MLVLNLMSEQTLDASQRDLSRYLKNLNSVAFNLFTLFFNSFSSSISDWQGQFRSSSIVIATKTW